MWTGFFWITQQTRNHQRNTSHRTRWNHFRNRAHRKRLYSKRLPLLHRRDTIRPHAMRLREFFTHLLSENFERRTDHTRSIIEN